jgi:hypothetical protein
LNKIFSPVDLLVIDLIGRSSVAVPTAITSSRNGTSSNLTWRYSC